LTGIIALIDKGGQVKMVHGIKKAERIPGLIKTFVIGDIKA